jgi:hypothetical protein
MERIRRHGDKGFKAFLVIFVISVFAGLGIGGFNISNQAGPAGRGVSVSSDVVLDPASKGTALIVNGTKVSSALLAERVASYQQMLRGQTEDPLNSLMIYGYASSNLIMEEALLGKARELGLKVAREDLEAERNKIVEQMAAVEQKSTGNMLGDLGKTLGSRREKKSMFNAALNRMGMTDSQWEAQASREILQNKVREKFQAYIDAAADVEAKATRDKVDAELTAGAEFSDMARKYSTAQDSAPQGGDMQQWLLPGLLPDDSNDQVLMATQPGEMTPWFEVPAGYQRWQVYDRAALEGEELEAAKERLIEQLRNQKDDQTYQPSDEEMAPLAFKVKARQIMIARNSDKTAQDQITDLVSTARIEINNPYVLAYQALFEDKLQPMGGIGYDQLLAVAQKSHAAEGYNYELIRGKLERGKPKSGTATDSESDKDEISEQSASLDLSELAKAPEASEADGNETGGQDSTTTAESTEDSSNLEADPSSSPDTSKPEVDDPSVPIYALAAGLLQQALEGEDPVGSAFGEGVIAKVYIDWLKSVEDLAGQPVQTDQAREEIEKRLARAVEMDNYNAFFHAQRGLNLAWLGRTEEAVAALETATEYASEQEGGPLSTVYEAYQKLEMDDKASAIKARLDAARERQLMEQIERAQAQQTAGGATAPINIDMGDLGQ